MLRRPGHPRRPPRRRSARHPPLRAGLRAALQGHGHAVVRRQLRGRRDAHPVRDVQPADQVQRVAGDRQRARRRPAGHRPLHRAAPGAVRAAALSCPAMPSATRATSCSPPRARSSASLLFPLGAYPKAEIRALAHELGLPGRRQVRQPGHLLRAQGPLHERHRAPEAGRRRSRRHRARGRPRARAAAGIVNYTIGQRRGSALPAARRSTSFELDAANRRVVVGPRESLHTHGIMLRRRELAGRRANSRRGPGRGRPDALERRATARHIVPVRRKCKGTAARR